MTSETEVPAGVNKVIEGVPYCPNCNLAMRPIASVDTTPKPNPGLGEGLPLAERLTKIRDAALEVSVAKSEWESAKEEAASAKKVYDGRVESMCTLITRLTSVQPPAERKPLLDAMEQAPEPEVATGECGATHEELVCVLQAGHEGEHASGNVAWASEAMVTAANEAFGSMMEDQVDALIARLASADITMDRATIDAWPVQVYDQVLRYLTALEDGISPFARPDRPACLPPLEGEPAAPAEPPRKRGRRRTSEPEPATV